MVHYDSLAAEFDRHGETMTTANLNSGLADVLGFDPTDPGFRVDPYPHYAELRRRTPAFRTPLGFWILTGYRECLQVLQDDRLGYPKPEDVSFSPALPGGYDKQQNFLIFMNPPDHTRLRRHVRGTLSPKVVHGLRPYVQKSVDRLLDECLVNEEFDLIAGFAHKLPFSTICELLGVPDDDRPRIMELAHDYLDGISPAFTVTEETARRRDAALVELNEYFAAMADARRAEPREDMMTSLARIADEGGMSHDELIGTCALLFVAGHSTTTNLIGNSVIALLRNPGQLELFRTEPDLAADAVEELVRYDTPTHMSFRYAFADVELGEGTVVREGEQVLIVRGAANRDPAAFPEPDRLDLRRPDNRHIGFGAGIHICLGSALARLQARVALTTLFDRAPGLGLATEELDYHESLVVRGVRELPVRTKGGLR